MTLKLPRTIRLDTSDTFVFDPAAEPGEWAVSGAFAFVDTDPDTLGRKARQAFRNGFLGVESFGWSTFVTVTHATEADRDAAVEALARQFVARFGAPGMDAARAAARDEVAFAASLCDHPINTLLAVERAVEGDGIRESFRVVQPPREKDHARIWELVPEDDGAAAPGDPPDHIDLLALAKRRS